MEDVCDAYRPPSCPLSTDMDGQDIVYHDFIDISVAVASPRVRSLETVFDFTLPPMFFCCEHLRAFSSLHLPWLTGPGGSCHPQRGEHVVP
jgi:hypothetical protein